MTRILHLLTASELVIWYAMSGSFPHGCDPRERNLAVQMILGLADEGRMLPEDRRRERKAA